MTRSRCSVVEVLIAFIILVMVTAAVYPVLKKHERLRATTDNTKCINGELHHRSEKLRYKGAAIVCTYTEI